MLGLWEYSTRKAEDADIKRDINLHARYAMESLLLTSGNPAQWDTFIAVNTTTISTLGIATRPYEASGAKLVRLVARNATDYEEYKRLLGLSGYEFQLRVYEYVTAQQAYPAVPQFHIGKSPPGTASERVVIERTGLKDGQRIRATLEVWTI